MNLTSWALAALGVFLIGFGCGWSAKTTRTNAATVKQVVRAAQIEAKNDTEVEKQDDGDKLKIRALENDLVAARRDALARSVPKSPHQRCVPTPEANAGAREAADTDGESARRYEEAYRRFRDELLTSSAVAEQLRLQVTACQAQWPQ